MRFIRGLDEKAQAKHSEYSIKNIRVMYETVTHSVPPDKTWHKRYRPRLIIELESSRLHGARFYRHNAMLVINADEIEQMQELLSERLLDSFHILVENKLFDAVGKAKDKSSA